MIGDGARVEIIDHEDLDLVGQTGRAYFKGQEPLAEKAQDFHGKVEVTHTNTYKVILERKVGKHKGVHEIECTEGQLKVIDTPS